MSVRVFTERSEIKSIESSFYKSLLDTIFSIPFQKPLEVTGDLMSVRVFTERSEIKSIESSFYKSLLDTIFSIALQKPLEVTSGFIPSGARIHRVPIVSSVSNARIYNK